MHPDVHIAGLADDCERCAELAAWPIRDLDDEVLAALVRLAVHPNRLSECRSLTEAVASASVLTALERVGRLAQVAPDAVADYLKTRWSVDTLKAVAFERGATAWCTCGAKTPQAAGHKLGCPARGEEQ